MAARIITGSARIRAAQSKVDQQKISEEIAEILTRMEEVRAVIFAAIETLRGQNVRIDADVAAALKRAALKPISALVERLEKLTTKPV